MERAWHEECGELHGVSRLTFFITLHLVTKDSARWEIKKSQGWSITDVLLPRRKAAQRGKWSWALAALLNTEKKCLKKNGSVLLKMATPAASHHER